MAIWPKRGDVNGSRGRIAALLGLQFSLIDQNEAAHVEKMLSEKVAETSVEIAKKLAAEKINIEYAYLATAPNAEKGVLIFRPNNLKKAFEVLS